MRFTITEPLEAPREAVFDVISDPERRVEWQTSLARVSVETPGSPGLGTRWYELMRGGLRFDLEITEFERPRRWAERAEGRFARASLSVQLEPGASAASTELTVRVAIDFKGLARLASPLVRALMPSALRADLRRVEALANRPRPI